MPSIRICCSGVKTVKDGDEYVTRRVIFNNHPDFYIGYKINDSWISKYYRHSEGVYFTVHFHRERYLDIDGEKIENHIEVEQIEGEEDYWNWKDDWLEGIIIENEDNYNLCLADEALVNQRKQDQKDILSRGM
jgi:hypothetical protein